MFSSVVDDRDTDRGHGHGVAGPVVFLLIIPIAAPAERPGVIVIVAEIGHIVESVHIDVLGPLAVVISYVGHVLLVEESVPDPEEVRIV